MSTTAAPVVINLEMVKAAEVVCAFLRNASLAYKNLTVAELIECKHLKLGGIALKSLPPELGMLTNLEVLDVSVCELTALPKELGNLSQLKKLYAHNNRLTEVPKELGDLTNLEYITLSDNQLTSLPVELANLTNLTELIVRRNQLTTIPAEFGRLSKLANLYISYNKLAGALPDALGELKSLKSCLLVGNTSLTSIPLSWIRRYENDELGLDLDATHHLVEQPLELIKAATVIHALLGTKKPFTKVEKIATTTELALTNLELETLPPEIGQLTNLERLYLGNNKLTALPQEIGNLTKLRVLELGDNALTCLPPTIGNLTNLEELRLRDNPICTLPDEFSNLANLNLLSLSFTKIQVLPDTLNSLTKLKSFYLEGMDSLTRLPTDWVRRHHDGAMVLSCNTQAAFKKIEHLLVKPVMPVVTVPNVATVSDSVGTVQIVNGSSNTTVATKPFSWTRPRWYWCLKGDWLTWYMNGLAQSVHLSQITRIQMTDKAVNGMTAPAISLIIHGTNTDFTLTIPYLKEDMVVAQALHDAIMTRSPACEDQWFVK